ncbi:MAG TPA: hypothetical protein PLK45_02150, partial [Paludibacteraceae bacterium]|nr:hypothetical protein [Paludibacteraceae bacterium]
MRKDGVFYHSAEIGGELGIVFPSLLMPFSTKSFRQQSLGTTELSASYNFQRRPEYVRNIANVAFKYVWMRRN